MCGTGIGGTLTSYVKVPDQLQVIYKNDNGHEAVKLVMLDHEIVNEDDVYFDDLEEGNYEDSEYDSDEEENTDYMKFSGKLEKTYKESVYTYSIWYQ
jgi:hypothetical protein